MEKIDYEKFVGKKIYEKKQKKKKIIGRVNCASLFDKQAIIECIDGTKHSIEVKKIINVHKLKGNTKPYDVEFIAIWRKNKWEISNIYILDSSERYILPPETLLSDSAMVPGWTVVELCDWYAKAWSPHSFEECKERLINRAKLAGATCVIDVVSYTMISRTDNGRLSFTYCCRGRLANIAKTYNEGNYRLNEFVNLNATMDNTYLKLLNIKKEVENKKWLFVIAALPICIPLVYLHIIFSILPICIVCYMLLGIEHDSIWLERDEIDTKRMLNDRHLRG